MEEASQVIGGQKIYNSIGLDAIPGTGQYPHFARFVCLTTDGTYLCYWWLAVRLA